MASSALAGTVTGQIQTPSTGRGIANGTLTFTLSQAAVVSGTATLAGNGSCWTDSAGNIVGLPGDAAVAAPMLSSNLGSGSLGSGTYFVRTTWANATGESQPSAERSLVLGGSGTLIVQAPVNVPALATSMKVYIGSASGGETLQGSVAVTSGVIAGNYNQATPLVNGAALPASNTSLCQIRFNDELQPSFTAYSVALTNSSGAGIAGFPQKWYLSGGSNGTVNVSNGTPLYAGVVQYPQAIVSNPAANGTQSINGGLNLNGFSLSNLGTLGPVTGTQSTTFGSHTTTTELTGTPPSPFPINAPFNSQFDYLAVSVNGLDFGSEIFQAEGRQGLDVIAGGIHVPSTQTATSGGFALQTNALAGYVFNEGPNADPVALFGMARANYNSTGQNQSWAGNLWCGDTSGMTQAGSCYALEIDVNQVTTNLSGWAQDFNGNWTGGSNNYGGLLFVKPGGGPAKFWKPGIEFGTGATQVPDTTGNAAMIFMPVATGSSQNSQGMMFESINSLGTTQYAGLQMGANGTVYFNVPGTRLTFEVDPDATVELKRLNFSLGVAPSVGSCTGLGTGSCSLSAGSGDSNGSISLQPTGAPSSSGNITLTFNSPLGTNAANCVYVLSDANNGWGTGTPGTGGATLTQTNADSTSSITLSWNNNGVNLGSGSTYRINYFCGGR